MTEYIPQGADVFGEGYRPNLETTFLELHRLLAIFLSSKSFADLRSSNGEVWEPIDHLQQYEEDEITRILLALAITARVMDDRNNRILDLIAGDCGSLAETSEQGSTETHLSLREACNKIIHAKKIRFDVSKNSAAQTFLNPTIYLYGDRNNSVHWKASLNIIAFSKEYVSCLRHL